MVLEIEHLHKLLVMDYTCTFLDCHLEALPKHYLS